MAVRRDYGLNGGLERNCYEDDEEHQEVDDEEGDDEE